MQLCSCCQKAYGVENEILQNLGGGTEKTKSHSAPGHVFQGHEISAINLNHPECKEFSGEVYPESCSENIEKTTQYHDCKCSMAPTSQTLLELQSPDLADTVESVAGVDSSSKTADVDLKPILHSLATQEVAGCIDPKSDRKEDHRSKRTEPTSKRIKLEPPVLERTPSVKSASPLDPTTSSIQLASLEPAIPPSEPITQMATPLPKPTNPPLCSACLGILDGGFLQNLAKYIMEKLIEANYVGVEMFCLSISTPLSLLIRRIAVYSYLRRNIGDVTMVMPDENFVKEMLRSKLRGLLQVELLPLKYNSEGPFQIVVKIDQESSIEECKSLIELVSPGTLTQKKKGRKVNKSVEISISLVKKALEHTLAEDFRKNQALLVPTAQCSYAVEFLHSPIYIAGRYNKYSRALPQTPWVVEGVKKADTSVQELIFHQLLRVIPASEVKFSASGREDVDVRMLGSGRPFLMEIINPRKVNLSGSEVSQIQESVNSSTDLISVKYLKVVPKEATRLLKEGEEDKRKFYSALIWASEEITPEHLTFLSKLKDLQLEQKTPLRVLHRRTLATRTRMVYSLQATFIDEHHFQLLLSTQAGTYIKEFVHGDFGRTQPNLCKLMKQEVDILTLDVQDVELEWPPK